MVKLKSKPVGRRPRDQIKYLNHPDHWHTIGLAIIWLLLCQASSQRDEKLYYLLLVCNLLIAVGIITHVVPFQQQHSTG